MTLPRPINSKKLVLTLLTSMSALVFCLMTFSLLTTGTSDLPDSCTSWISVTNQVACRTDLSKTHSDRTCYDNFNYINCNDIAESIRDTRITLILSALLGVLLLTVVNSIVGNASLYVWIPGLLSLVIGLVLIAQPNLTDIVSDLLS